MNIRRIAVLGAALFAVVALVGCSPLQTGETAIQDMNTTEATVKNLTKSQPLKVYNYSQERANLLRRLDTWNTANKVGYIACISYGKVMFTSPFKGKVSSVNSLVSNPQQVAHIPNVGYETIPSPDLDGSYGDNPPGGIFWFTPDGRYLEWKGDYLLSDQPFTLVTPPSINVNVSGDKQ